MQKNETEPLVSLPEPQRTLQNIRHILQRRLAPAYGDREADAMVRLIFAALKDWTLTDLLVHADTILSPYILEKIDHILRGLADRQPLQYLLGKAYFYGMDLDVTPAVLIPRPETAELVDIILKDVRDNGDHTDLKVLDIGTGSGAIAIALARNLRFPDIYALDVSPDALEVARHNAKLTHTHIKFLQDDILTAQTLSTSFDSFDIVVSNPPYVLESEKKDMERNVLDYEPHIALFVPDCDPMRFYRPITAMADKILRRGGKLYLEINPLCSTDIRHLLYESGFDDIQIIPDSQGRRRFATATKTLDR